MNQKSEMNKTQIVNPSQVRHKLYMRMVMKMTEKFGSTTKSVGVIKATLDKHLEGKNQIDPGVSFNLIS